MLISCLSTSRVTCLNNTKDKIDNTELLKKLTLNF
jgi:hypothetical protein